MPITKKLDNENLENINGGNSQNDTIEIIENAIYKSKSGVRHVYVKGVYSNYLVSYYGAKLVNGVYKYGGSMNKSTISSFAYDFDIKNPILNVKIEHE